ncbi:MAG: hypothetical protein WAM05_03955 [Candidatus Binataceae bacterium]
MRAMRISGWFFLLAACSMVCASHPALAQENENLSPAQEKFVNMEKAMPQDKRGRFYKLGEIGVAAIAAGEYDKAERYAQELLSDAPDFHKDWNYGNAIFDGNMVLGLVALKRDDDVAQADSDLLGSAATPGSPQLGSFGPNMLLAQALLERGEESTVLAFLAACRSFWKMAQGQDKLDAWSDTIEQRETPNFAPNLRW